MTLTVTTPAGALKAALLHAQRVAAQRSTIPILSHVALRAGGSGARIEACDMEISLHQDLPGQVGGEGGFTFDPRFVLPALDAVPADAAVRFLAHGLDHQEVEIAIGPIVLRPAAMVVEDMPEVAPLPDGSPSFTLSSDELTRLFGRVRHAISSEETRYYLNGIYLHRRAGMLRAVATDGHRILWEEMPAPPGMPEGLELIVPTAVVKLVLALLDGAAPEDLQFQVKAGTPKIMISGTGWAIAAKCIDGTFPDYERTIPAADHMIGSVVVHAPAALSAILAGMVGTFERSVPALIRRSGDGVQLVTHSSDRGRATAFLPPEDATWCGEGEQGVGLQVRYLRDTCEALPGGFRLSVNRGEAGPVLIHGIEVAAVGAIMPMRIDRTAMGA